MDDALHPIFDRAWELSAAGLEPEGAAELRAALCALSDPEERTDAVVALAALAEVLRRHGEVETSRALLAVAAEVAPVVAQGVLQVASAQGAAGAGERFTGFSGQARGRFEPPAAPKDGAVRVGVGLRFRLGT